MKDFYWPRGHTDLSRDQETIRHGLAAIHAGSAALALDVKSMPVDHELSDLLKQFLAKAVALKS